MEVHASNYVTNFTMVCTSVTVEKDTYFERMDIVVMVSRNLFSITNEYKKFIKCIIDGFQDQLFHWKTLHFFVNVLNFIKFDSRFCK